MKRLMIGGLSVLLASFAVAPAAQAQVNTIDTVDGYSAYDGSTYLSRTNPFELVYLSYFGQFEAQGIPGYENLISDYRSGEIEAEDLVQAAIDQNRLPADTLENDRYVNFVQYQLRRLENTDSGR